MLERMASSEQRRIHRERIKNGAIVDIPEGRVTVLYGDHSKRQDPRQIPQGVDGVILEGVDGLVDPRRTLKEFETNTQYQSIMQLLEKEEIPVYLADAQSKGIRESQILATLGMSDFLKLVPAATIAGEMAFRRVRKEKISRRGFLARGLVAAWLMFPSLSDNESLRQSVPEIQKVTEAISPEALPLVPYRNALNAYKIKQLLKIEEEEYRRKRHLAVVIGAAHVGIEDALTQSDEETLRYIRRVAPVAGLLYDPRKSSEAAKLAFESGNWRVVRNFSFPELVK